MLSLHSSYLQSERCFGNSFSEEGGVSTDLHVRPRKDISRFCTDGLRIKRERARAASMAAMFLSSSPDLASSLISEYFRSESLNDELCPSLPGKTEQERPSPPTERKEIADPLSHENIDGNARKQSQKEKEEKSKKLTKQKSLLRCKSEDVDSIGVKKTVKFADDNGLPLATVKEFKRFDYFEALREQLYENSLPDPDLAARHVKPPSPPPTKKDAPAPAKFICDFPIPSHHYARFQDKVMRNKVCLENILASDNRVAGTVRVHNYVFRKKVFVRYTTDKWRTTKEVECKFVDNGLVGSMSETDSFSFDLTGPSPCRPDAGIQFCIRFEAENEEHWDNNDGKNYSLVTAEFFRLRQNVREEEERTGFRY